MAKRKPKQQSIHDRHVRKRARKLKKQGWDVEADISGFEQPEPIGNQGKIPDIVATKSGAKKIIEVETPDTVQKDKKQHEVFSRSAGQKKRATFTIEETE